jgi:hypothetical protein
MFKSIFNDTVKERIKEGKFLHAPLTSSEYNCNSSWYRAPEFDTIDWANSAVIFGCSNVFGIGVDDEHTVSSQLSKLIDMPVINMGIGATSMEFSFYNSMILSNNYPTPKAVINIWTSIERTTYYFKNSIINHGSWNMNEKYMDAYNQTDSHPEVHALMMQMISKQIWLPKTKYYEASFFGSTTQLLGIPALVSEDLARDEVHPGPKTLYNLAVKIKEELCL